jgi:uncharacterized phiE125 gp8 family phage protein
MIVTRTVNPYCEPVTLDEIKDHLRIEHNNHDSQLLGFIKASRELVEDFTRRALVQQTWKYYLQDWPSGDEFELPFPPLQSVTHIKYTDSDDDQTTWSADDYEVDTDSEPGRIILAYGKSWPSTTLHPKNPIEVQFVAGYDDDGDSPPDYTVNIPEGFKNAMKLDIEIRYERPESAYKKALEDTRDALLYPYKIWRF